ncbi:LacI family DNA-binding transcriptional regulator [Streptomyces niveiscabiei]|uniref:LacI family DNA-binding transcriptional regulator n=1 Tax=Streptomyces niveiscabiei TaxID=164115 RepID=UPI0029B282C4|nr:LacI family DNA-binding transcriptional regulator [Streptomyces niveiscabiei]MDX3388112.1 LacI family DNA-binding transcriptional regulator [Streptomyces niveiscabiei]
MLTQARRPTIEDVARRAGVSRTTVSRVLNGAPKVRAEVIEKVREVIADLGYVPNQAARQLVTRRTGAVAVVATQPQDRLFMDPFFDCLLRGIRRELTRHGAQAVLLFLDEPDDHARVADYLGGGHVDGAILFSLRPDDHLGALIARTGLPAVFGGRSRAGADDTAYVHVDCDNRGGARQAVTHLRALGRTRVATVTGPYDQEPSADDRLTGYRDVLPDADPALTERADYTEHGAALAMHTLLDRRPDLDAVFAASDLMAAGVLQALHERGRRVPEDVAVVGFDDLTRIAEATTPPLTTVHADVEGMGRLMAELLCAAVYEGTTPGSVVVPTRLVVRESA